MGKRRGPWQDTTSVLHRFDKQQKTAREKYRLFVEKGIALGQRKDLIGGGLIRSYQGWRPSQGGERVKGDERILGSSASVLDALRQAEEPRERKHRLKAQGIGFDAVLEKVSALLNCTPDEILSTGKYRSRVAARSLPCYFLVWDLGMTATALAQKLAFPNLRLRWQRQRVNLSRRRENRACFL